MGKTVVVVLASPRDGVRLPADGAPFRRAIDANPRLREAVEVRSAETTGDLTPVQEAEVIECGNLSSEVLAAAPRLKWVSFWASGLDRRMPPGLEARQVLVTNAAGIHAPNIAEHVMAYMLHFTRRFETYAQAQRTHKWVHHEEPSEELLGQTLGIVGLGATGGALAVRARSFGMRVLATKRDGSNADGLADAVFPPREIASMLEQADHVAITVPYTKETHHLLDAAMLARMKPTAYLYNTSRGALVDEAALIAALRAGRLRGAGLDVFETEPLPADSPFWDMPNVIVTPHAAGFTPYYFARAATLFADNLVRYLDGQPLQNRFDRVRGY